MAGLCRYRMKTLALILARGGSKRLPGKNIKELVGKPLIAWSIQAALGTPSVDRVLVSTDSPDIQKAALQHGAEAPFLRPEELSSDKATSVDAALHALDYAEKNWGAYDAVLLLEPTSPLRHKDDLEKGVRLLKENFATTEAVVSLGKIQLENPAYAKVVENGFIKPTEMQPKAGEYYFPYGVMYLVKASVLREKRTFYPDVVRPYFIERWQNYEVDDMCDFVCVESILKSKLNEVLK